MKTIGLIGGMSWESTITYYKTINEEIKNRLGGLHSGKILLYSVDFDEIEKYQANDQWEKSGEILGKVAKKLENAGSDFILICTNTMHKVAPQIASRINIPLIHIGDATADALEKAGIKNVALLGTKYTMRQDFYKERLINRGFKVVIPNDIEIEEINKIIFNELCLGSIKSSSRTYLSNVINNLKLKGAEAVILGCTEIGLLVSKEDSSLPIFDTTLIHAKKAVDLALKA